MKTTKFQASHTGITFYIITGTDGLEQTRAIYLINFKADGRWTILIFSNLRKC